MQAQSCLNNHREDVEALEGWIARLIENDRFRLLDDEFGHAFRTWHQFCATRQPYGLGYSPDAIEQIVCERRRAQELAADPAFAAAGKRGGQEKNSNAENEVAKGHFVLTDSHSGDSSNEERRKAVANGHSTPLNQTGSNSAERIVRRLKRDAPEVADALARGEYRSARAAGIAAGIVKVPTLVESAARIVTRMTDSELHEFETVFDAIVQQRKAAE